MNQTTTNRGIVLTTAASLLWGTVFIAIGIGLRYLDPYTLLFMRFLVSAIPIIILVLSFERRLHIFSELKRPAVWLLAFIYFLGFLMQYAWQDMSSTSDTTLISNMVPIIAPIGAFLLLKEKVRIAQVLGLTLGLVGPVFIALPKMSSDSKSSAMGDALLFLASIGYAAFILTGKNLVTGPLANRLKSSLQFSASQYPFQ